MFGAAMIGQLKVFFWTPRRYIWILNFDFGTAKIQDNEVQKKSVGFLQTSYKHMLYYIYDIYIYIFIYTYKYI